MRSEFGAEDWSYMPHTYILPAEKDQLRKVMRRAKGSFWIVKPPNLFCGMGIKVINDFKDVPVKKGQLCVQRYLKKPLLINNLKFDLRVYVLVTSVEPLRIYLYEEGLARPAAVTLLAPQIKLLFQHVILLS
jgi:tubulin polyglutamylase TTLL4